MGPHLLVALTVLFAVPVETAQQPEASQKDRAKMSADVKDIVTVFFQNWAKKEPNKSQGLFLNPDVSVVEYDNIRKRHEVKQMKVSALLKEWQTSSANFLRVESMTVDVVNSSLAVVRSEYVLGGINGRGVFTLIFKDGGWKIVSLVMENRFTW